MWCRSSPRAAASKPLPRARRSACQAAEEVGEVEAVEAEAEVVEPRRRAVARAAAWRRRIQRRWGATRRWCAGCASCSWSTTPGCSRCTRCVSTSTALSVSTLGSVWVERERGPGGLTREVETPLRSTHSRCVIPFQLNAIAYTVGGGHARCRARGRALVDEGSGCVRRGCSDHHPLAGVAHAASARGAARHGRGSPAPHDGACLACLDDKCTMHAHGVLTTATGVAALKPQVSIEHTSG